MACFVVPAAEAVITTVVQKVVSSKEKACEVSANNEHVDENASGIRFSTKLGWLNKLLWGGSALLAFEHFWHGEITPFFPFLTAVENGETAGMLAEMGSVGVTMAVLVTAVWAGMVGVTSIIEKRSAANEAEMQEGSDS